MCRRRKTVGPRDRAHDRVVLLIDLGLTTINRCCHPVTSSVFDTGDMSEQMKPCGDGDCFCRGWHLSTSKGIQMHNAGDDDHRPKEDVVPSARQGGCVSTVSTE